MLDSKEIQIPLEFMEKLAELSKPLANNKVRIKLFDWGEKTTIDEEAIKIQARSGSGAQATISQKVYNESTIIQGVAEAPWKVNDVATVRSLAPFLMEWLKDQIQEYNSLGEKKKTSSADGQTE